MAFHHRCKRYFSQELLLEHYCEEFHSDIQHINSSYSEDGGECTYEEVDEKSFIHETLSSSTSKE